MHFQREESLHVCSLVFIYLQPIKCHKLNFHRDNKLVVYLYIIREFIISRMEKSFLYFISCVACIFFITFFSSSINSWEMTELNTSLKRNCFKCLVPCCCIFTFCFGREHCCHPCLLIESPQC